MFPYAGRGKLVPLEQKSLRHLPDARLACQHKTECFQSKKSQFLSGEPRASARGEPKKHLCVDLLRQLKLAARRLQEETLLSASCGSVEPTVC